MSDLVRFPLDEPLELRDGDRTLSGRAIELALAVGPAGDLSDAVLRLRVTDDDVTVGLDEPASVGPTVVTLRLVDHVRAEAPANAVAFRRRLRSGDVLTELASWTVVGSEDDRR